MPQDFFADGFDDQQGLTFTKEQNQFLQAKIPFLDPRRSYQIPMGNVLSLLKFAGLQPDVIKKIITNSCKEGSKTVTYDQMKKIFRGVALKQNRIQPSKINIQANIKTKMPIFYDEDDSDQQQEIIKNKQENTNKTSPNVQPTNQPPLKQQNLQQSQHLSQPPKPVPQQQQITPPPASNDPLKIFDQYWKTLPIHKSGLIIQGNHVKKLCSTNNQNKNNLSKAWKLCNISQKGSLTKGQFFVFMNLVNSNNIPDSLTKEMKDIILKIQNASGYKKQQKVTTHSQITERNKSSSKEIVKQSSTKQVNVSISKSNIFDKFGDQNLFDNSKGPGTNNNIKRESLEPKNQSFFVQNTQKTSSIKTSSFGNNSQIINNNSSSNALSQIMPNIIKKAQSLTNASQNTQKQLKSLTLSTQQLNNNLQLVQKYLTMMTQSFVAQQQQISALKQTQTALNQRISNVCISMKNIITKQAECINFMVQSTSQQNQQNIQRLKVLQGYTQQMGRIVDNNIANGKNLIMKGKKQTNEIYTKVKIQSQKVVKKIEQGYENNYSGNYVEQTNMQKNKNQSPFKKKPIQQNKNKGNQSNRSNNMSQSPQHNPFDDNNQDQNQTQNHNHNHHIQRRQSIDQSQNIQSKQTPHSNQQQQQFNLQNLTEEQKIKMKQMQLIQMVNYITPIKQQQYAGVVSRITAMTQQQMNTLYSKLYTMYLQKQQNQRAQRQQQDQQQRKKGQQFPNVDQFNTSRFIQMKNNQNNQVKKN